MLLLAATMPVATAEDDCAVAPRCQRVTTEAAGNPHPAVEHRTYYVYLDAAACNPPAAGRCAGHPGPNLMGLVYQETNGFAGLQRQPTYDDDGKPVPPDTLVLL